MTEPHAAVLWDMDGTLVDTEPYWIETEHALVAEHGGTWTDEDALALVGSALLDAGAYMVEHAALPLTPAEVVDRLLDGVVARVQESVPWRPGAVELLLDLHDAGVPCALVTMSYTRFVEPILAQLPAGVFSAVVTGDQVTHGKPHPEPYLTAAASSAYRPRTAWPSRTPAPVRRPRPPRAAPCWSCRTTCRSPLDRHGSSPTPWWG